MSSSLLNRAIPARICAPPCLRLTFTPALSRSERTLAISLPWSKVTIDDRFPAGVHTSYPAVASHRGADEPTPAPTVSRPSSARSSDRALVHFGEMCERGCEGVALCWKCSAMLEVQRYVGSAALCCTFRTLQRNEGVGCASSQEQS